MKNKEQTFASKLLNIQILQLIDEIRNKFKESDKLNQIIKIITEDNELESSEQLANARKTLLKSCFNEDIEIVRWLVKREFTDENGISYKIDSSTKTASIFSISSTQKDIFLSKSIKYNDIEYIITNIFCFSCNFIFNTIEFFLLRIHSISVYFIQILGNRIINHSIFKYLF